MANQARGEVSIEVDGRRYTLRPTINAICDLEDREGQTFTTLAERAGKGDIRAMRALIWAYLQDRHGDEITTPQLAGAWIERAGGLTALDGAMRRVTAANAAPGPVDPPEAQPALVGATSTSKGAASG